MTNENNKTGHGVTISPVKRVMDAQGCYCQQCQSVIADDCSPFWHWRKSQAMHERGTGHDVIMFRYESAASNLSMVASDTARN